MTSPLKKRLSLMASCRGAFLGVAVLSGLINLLYLSGSIFMMEVYDRVLPSRSIPTLVGLSVIIVVLYLFQGLFDALRGRIMARVGAALDDGGDVGPEALLDFGQRLAAAGVLGSIV